jgi:hypothetical protein
VCHSRKIAGKIQVSPVICLFPNPEITGVTGVTGIFGVTGVTGIFGAPGFSVVVFLVQGMHATRNGLY